MKNCPNCGRPIDFEEKYAKIVACPYCNAILEFGKGEFTQIGEQGYFIEFPSQFNVREETNFAGKNLYIKGQLRYEYDGGFFDDYFTEIDGKTFYIREDDGIISMIEEIYFEKNDLNLSNKEPGSSLKFEGKKYYIEEVGVFKLANLKGFITTKLSIGKEYEYLIGINSGKKYFFEKEVGTDILRILKEK